MLLPLEKACIKNMDLLNVNLKWNTSLKKIRVAKLLIEMGLKELWFLKNKKN